MRSLNIGIDASALSLADGRGGRRGVLTLIRSLIENPTPHRYVIFTSDKELPSYFPPDPRFQWEHPRQYIPMLYRRGTGWLGRIFLKDLDLVHFPRHDVWYSNRGKAVVNIHDLAPLRFPEYFFTTKKEESRYQLHLEMTVKHAAVIVTNSHFTREEVLRFLPLPPERVETVYPGTDHVFLTSPPSFSQEELKSFGVEGPYFLFVGWVDFRKNISLLLKAFSLYRNRGGRADLVLLGKQDPRYPKYYPPLDPLLDSMKERNHIFWLQNITDNILPRFYASAKALVLPSLFEGYGCPLVEAMACGTAMIATRIPAYHEIAGEAAILVELDEEEMAKAMLEIDRDESFRQHLIDLGKKRSQQFFPDRLAREMLKIYADVAAMKK